MTNGSELNCLLICTTDCRVVHHQSQIQFKLYGHIEFVQLLVRHTFMLSYDCCDTVDMKPHVCYMLPKRQNSRSNACALLNMSDHGYLVIQAMLQALQLDSWGLALNQIQLF